MTYARPDLGQTIAEFVANTDAREEAIRTHERGVVEPGIRPPGLIHNSTNALLIQAAAAAGELIDAPGHNDALLHYTGSGWSYLLDTRHAGLNAGGTVAMIADLAMGSNRIVNLGDGAAATDGAAVGQVVLRDGSNALTGDLDAGARRITNLAEAVDDDDAVTKAQAQSLLAGGGGVAHFQTTSQADRADSGPEPGNTAYVSRILETDFTPERVRIVIDGDIREADDGDRRLADFRAQIEVARVRDPGGNESYQLCGWWIQDAAPTTASSWNRAVVFHEYQAGSPPNGWDFEVTFGAGGGGTLYLRGKWHTGATKGFEWWLWYVTAGAEFMNIDAFGGNSSDDEPGEGNVQVWITGGGDAP